MEAIVPAAGEGTRLRPLTADRPKGLVDVAGRPLLSRCFDTLTAMGISRAIVVVGYHGEQIRERYGGSYRDMELVYAEQPAPLGLAHAVGVGASRLDGPAVVLFGDVVFARPPIPILSRLEGGDVDVVVGLERVPIDQARRHTVCELREDDSVRRLEEKPSEPSARTVMAGVVAGTGRLFDATTEIEPSSRGEFELADAIQRVIDGGGTAVGVQLKGKRINVNTRDDLSAAERLHSGDGGRK